MIGRIKFLIENTGLSERAFALRCGINQPTLFNQLKGNRAVSLQTLESILKAFPEVSADWLICGKGQMLKEDISADKRGMDRVNSLVDTIAILQEAINTKTAMMAQLQERIAKLEAELNAKK